MKDINKTEINMDQLEIVTGGFINSCDPALEVESCDPPLGKTGPLETGPLSTEPMYYPYLHVQGIRV